MLEYSFMVIIIIVIFSLGPGVAEALLNTMLEM